MSKKCSNCGKFYKHFVSCASEDEAWGECENCCCGADLEKLKEKIDNAEVTLERSFYSFTESLKMAVEDTELRSLLKNICDEANKKTT